MTYKTDTTVGSMLMWMVLENLVFAGGAGELDEVNTPYTDECSRRIGDVELSFMYCNVMDAESVVVRDWTTCAYFEIAAGEDTTPAENRPSDQYELGYARLEQRPERAWMMPCEDLVDLMELDAEIYLDHQGRLVAQWVELNERAARDGDASLLIEAAQVWDELDKSHRHEAELELEACKWMAANH